MKRTAVVLVHGLFSSANTWQRLNRLISSDPELAGFILFPFKYKSPKYNLSPLRRIPDFDTVAESLETYMELDVADYQNVVLISHSQGGIIVQRFLARTVSRARAHDLVRIRRIIMFACPNSGSELLAVTRRRFKLWRHPQENELRPLDDAVAAAHQTVIEHIVYAEDQSPTDIYIPIIAYAGESDNIVTLASAKGSFPDTGVVPGDHFSIIQPDTKQHRTYVTIKKNLLAATGTGHTSESSRNRPRNLDIDQRGPASGSREARTTTTFAEDRDERPATAETSGLAQPPATSVPDHQQQDQRGASIDSQRNRSESKVHEVHFGKNATEKYGSISVLIRELANASFTAPNWIALDLGTRELRKILDEDYDIRPELATRVHGLLADLHRTLDNAISPATPSKQLLNASRHAAAVRDTLITLLTL